METVKPCEVNRDLMRDQCNLFKLERFETIILNFNFPFIYIASVIFSLEIVSLIWCCLKMPYFQNDTQAKVMLPKQVTQTMNNKD